MDYFLDVFFNFSVYYLSPNCSLNSFLNNFSNCIPCTCLVTALYPLYLPHTQLTPLVPALHLPRTPLPTSYQCHTSCNCLIPALHSFYLLHTCLAPLIPASYLPRTPFTCLIPTLYPFHLPRTHLISLLPALYLLHTPFTYLIPASHPFYLPCTCLTSLLPALYPASLLPAPSHPFTCLPA